MIKIKKLDGTYKRIIAEPQKGDVYDRFGNKLNGSYRKLMRPSRY